MADLTEFGFREHPFPLIPDSQVTNWADRASEKALLRDVVESILITDTGLSEFVIILGSFGAGKSHALKYFCNLINFEERHRFQAKAIYLPKIKVDQKVTFARIYLEIVQELGRQFFNELAAGVSSRMDAAATAMGGQLERDQERELLTSDAEHFQKLVLQGIVDDDRPMVELLRALAKGEERVLSFLLEGKAVPGYSISAQAIDTDYVATKVLASLFRTMTLRLGDQEPVYHGVYLFIDEFEDVLDLKPVEQSALWTAIRELLNRLPMNFALVLAFSGDAALLEAMMPMGLAERTSRQNIELQALEVDEAKEFLRDHLASFRLEGFPVPQPFYPFTEDAIDYVLESVVLMVPRKIFRALRTVLERAIRREGLKPGDAIDGRLAEEILVRMGI